MTYDYVLVGGGLQNGLIRLALRARQPTARVALIERGRVGGNHTWCFHAGNASADWVRPLIVAQWDGYDVAFPAYRRALASPYACVTSERLAACIGDDVVTGTAVEVAADRVRLADGRELSARAVIDARGPERTEITDAGWQKFVGHELVFARPHGLVRPMLMDATVPQRDGFRFVYVLPLAHDRLLVEDTYFSASPDLDLERIRGEIAAYAPGGALVREETGVLPLPWKQRAPSAAAPLVAGYAGGWFHPVTGYSFPIAVRLAELIASLPADALHGAELAALARRHARQQRFAHRLNRMLFTWFAPEHRYGVLERFYRLPEPVIRRFYALELTGLDKARILVGRPPRGLFTRAEAA